ncbi:MAG: hypothetical protein Q8N96_13450 [Methylovulum sp.]|nr:hypothetical protein [Methylovulum sp.]
MPERIFKARPTRLWMPRKNRRMKVLAGKLLFIVPILITVTAMQYMPDGFVPRYFNQAG